MAERDAPEERGKAAYREQNYKDAAVWFSKALQLRPSSELRLKLLDRRAAAYEKIDGKLQGGLLDAKHMVKIDKHNPRGWLRLGKILVLMGKPEKAVDIYKRGLENCQKAVKDDMYWKLGEKALRDNYSKLVRKTRTHDMLVELPMELVDKILLYLDFASLMRCQRVCKHWNNYIGNSHYHTFRALDFSGTRHPPPQRTLKKYIIRSKGRAPVTEFKIHAGPQSYSNLLTFLSTSCPRLQLLQIHGEDWARTLSGSLSGRSDANLWRALKIIRLDTLISMSTVNYILNNCQQLQELGCREVSWLEHEDRWYLQANQSIEKLVLCGSSLSRMPGPPDLDESNQFHMPKLAVLELRNWSRREIIPPRYFSLMVNLRELISFNNIVIRLPRLPPSLVRLELQESYWNIGQAPAEEQTLPDLQVLNLSGSHVSNEYVAHLLRATAESVSLRELNLSGCHLLSVNSLDWLLEDGYCDKLETLHLASLSEIGDQVSREMGTLDMLRKIDLSYTSISGVGLLNIVNMTGAERKKITGRGLEEVAVVNCPIGIDAIQRVQSMGVKISYIQPRGTSLQAGVGGGRRVRYGDS